MLEHDKAPTTDDIGYLKNRVKQLKADQERLHTTIAELQSQIGRTEQAGYTIEEFMTALAARRGRTFRWRMDYIDATINTPGSHPVTMEDIQQWQRDGRVPVWAFEQIEQLAFSDHFIGKAHPGWSDRELAYLVELVTATPNERNDVLATKCCEHFGRDINVPAIKSQKHRLANKGRLPGYHYR